MDLVPFVPILVALALVAGIIVAVRRGLASEPQAVGERAELEGISGWLVLPAIGLVVGPIRNVAGLTEYLSILPLVTPGTPLHTFTVFELIANVALVLFSLVVAVSFFRRKRRAPPLFIAFLVAALLLAVGDTLIAFTLVEPEVVAEVMGGAITIGLIQAIIWIPYMLRSKRVAATFTR